MTETYRLSVYYDLTTDQNNELNWRDDEIEELSGGKIVGSGAGCDVRDCDVRFETIKQLQAAKVELQAAGFRFIRSCGCGAGQEPAN